MPSGLLVYRRIKQILFYRLLHLRTANCKFDAAKDTFREAMEITNKITSKNELDINLAVLYGEKCGLLFALSDYEEVKKISK